MMVFHVENVNKQKCVLTSTGYCKDGKFIIRSLYLSLSFLIFIVCLVCRLFFFFLFFFISRLPLGTGLPYISNRTDEMAEIYCNWINSWCSFDILWIAIWMRTELQMNRTHIVLDCRETRVCRQVDEWDA